jgi:hypothetical protein
LARGNANPPLLLHAVLAAALVGSWQWLTVTANFGGNWTALFCTGGAIRQPPLAKAEGIYLFQGSTGYDGQFYHYVAHDPLMRTNLSAYMDAPELRYRRILIPALAYGLALGRSSWIHAAYEAVFLLAVALGVYWSCRYAVQAGLRAAWGWLFVLLPAIPISMDRLVIDFGLATIGAGFLLYAAAPSWRLFLLLTCAVLVRETGILMVLAYCGHLLWRREIRTAAIFLLSAAPAAVWYVYAAGVTESERLFKPLPLGGILKALWEPPRYPPDTPLLLAVHTADYLALFGMLLAYGMGLYWFVRRPSDPICIAAGLFSLLGILIPYRGAWTHVYHYGRVYTPLLICLAGLAGERRSARLLSPIALMLPRLAIQLTPQLSGVMRWFGSVLETAAS